MSLTGVAAKQAPVVLPLFAGVALGDQVVMRVAAVVAGLAFGAMWRAGSLSSEGKPGSAIRKDLMISVLVGGANAVLVLSLAELMGLGPLLTMGLGTLVGATGLRAVPEARDALLDALRRKLLGNDIALINPRDPGLRKLAEKIDEE